MKILALITLLLAALPVFGKEWIPPYSVSYQDEAGLAPTEGKLLFRCTLNVNMNLATPTILLYGLNGSSESGVLEKDRTLKITRAPGTYVFQFYLDYFSEITTDSIEVKPGMLTIIDLRFEYERIPVTTEKPVIYLYPETDLEVTTLVEPQGSFLFTYPVYENGWKGTAHPDGSMTINGKNYPYLFWDAETTANEVAPAPGTGFVVSRDQVLTFLEEKLTSAGLNEREQADFITYWGPRLTQYDQVAIQFAWGASCDQFATLQLSPEPDNINRLYILWSQATGNEPALIPQQLPVFDRSGFDVLEWGGIQLPALFHPLIVQQ